MTKYIVTQRPHYIGGRYVRPNEGDKSVVDIDDTNEDPALRVTPGRLLVPYSKAAVKAPTAAPPTRTKGKLAPPKASPAAAPDSKSEA